MPWQKRVEEYVPPMYTQRDVADVEIVTDSRHQNMSK